jgi:hypothetical protein
MKTVRRKRVLNRLTRKNIIGRGMQGTVYNAVNSNGVHYALKDGRIGKEEIEFAKTVAVKYPKHFMTLYDYSDNLTVYSKINLTLQEYIKQHKFNPSLNIMYDFYIQIFYILSILQKEGWTHNDFHIGNIGLLKTTEPTIKINGHTIQTHGYLLQAIDYGDVIHSPSKTYFRLFDLVYNEKRNNFFLLKHLNINFSHIELINIKKQYTKISNKHIHDLHILLYGMLYPLKFKELYPMVNLLVYLPIKTMLYILKHMNNPKKSLDYLINHRKNSSM